MSDSPRTWTALKPSPAVDAALRGAAAGVCGLRWNDQYSRWFLDRGDGNFPDLLDPWLPDQSRDDLARVFVAALDRWRREVGGLTEERFDKALIWQRLWFLALTDPRAALAGLLDLLGIPVPEGLTNE